MTTTQDLVWDCKRLLEANLRQEQNTLNGAYTAGGASLTFSESMRSILEGAELEIDSELFRVTSVSGSTAQVKGAQRGTTAANHANGANVIVNPRFTVFSIMTDINNALNEMEGAGLYREAALSITFNAEVSGYDLTGSTDVFDILAVDYEDTGPGRRFPAINSFTLKRNMDTADFASGNAIVIDHPAFPGQPLRVRYSAPFTRTTSLSDDAVSTLGLTSSMLDLPVLGATIRQMQTRDTRRSFLEAQPDTRRSSEVQIGAAQNSIATLRRTYQSRLDDELSSLLQRYPYFTRR
jgi:hypothetical protein